MTTLIFDTTPLNHFALAGRLAVLERLTASYRRVVAQAVLDELRIGETHHPPLADVRNAEWLEMVACDGLEELRAFAQYVRILGSGQRDMGKRRSLHGRRFTVRSPCSTNALALRLPEPEGLPFTGRSG